MDKSKIRNFSIIAHIDHGKSTLADRILEITNTLEKREMQEQILDSMDIERERGITIKLNSIQLEYKAKDGENYTFHLIDTPGHVDFSYEVSRSLAACEGAILVVDATQGVEAQTLANVYLALENDLEIIPVINKMDLPSADVERVKKEIEDTIGLDASDAPLISAKTGLNIVDVLEAVVAKIPYPIDADDNKPLRALIFDSYYDKYLGVVMSIRVKEGTIKVGDKIHLMSTNADYEVTAVGIKTPKILKKGELEAGEVGWIAASIKTIKDIHVGDTITKTDNPATIPLPGYKKMKPMVYCGIYPLDTNKYQDFKEALEKIELSDSSLVYEPETSQALGFGFRCGFLGLLHMEVIQERLEREYNLALIATAPSVIYKIHLTNGEMIEIDNPAKMPDPQKITKIEEPFVNVKIMTPKDYIGDLMNLCQNKLGIYKDLEYVDDNRMILIYDMPLAEIIFDFFNKLKSISKGYASFEYELIGYKESKLVKMDILLNGDMVDAFSMIVNSKFAYQRGAALTKKLKELIPRQNFEVPIQAAIGNKVLARETIKAYRKDVIWKLHAADISRKKKLFEKQKEGKKRMKEIGNVEVPQEAFIAVLKLDE
ncbi:GTP-binding protein LepA [Williamsoniiplasma luminosum]|uniref:Elongation factor 4 n=1 Tax=Williamsoniiplasma luminosum TaxID=214888 RepID=A0A2K8NUQ2_9MOLU|nr:translation elongation factor 4 [Williamsoniiplasma luminosum]ATZ17572.1 GTP-binding protein LepA [Williamsoniiplasma luminosum]AVP49386.1 MAG: elongation factor 4 [Williamsoniiplasma luminosum]